MVTTEPGAYPAPSAQERRHLTLLFADLTASTTLAARLEAEQFALLMQRLSEVYRQIIPRHRGMVTRIQGDGLLAVFGLGVAREDDGCCVGGARRYDPAPVKQGRDLLTALVELALRPTLHRP